jgi:hypothetical protein
MTKYLGFVLAVTVGGLPAVAIAQDAPATPQGVVVVQNQPRAGQTSSDVQASGPRYTGRVFSLFGIPVRLAAPVPPPYAGTAYTTFAGQPETGLDAVMAEPPGSEPRN